MNTDPVTPACMLTEGEISIARELDPEEILRAFCGTNSEITMPSTYSVERAVKSFQTFLDDVEYYPGEGVNDAFSLFSKVVPLNEIAIPVMTGCIRESLKTLDSNTSVKIAPEVREIMKKFFCDCCELFPKKLYSVGNDGRWD